jgi:hypothetical protein
MEAHVLQGGSATTTHEKPPFQSSGGPLDHVRFHALHIDFQKVQTLQDMR